MEIDISILDATTDCTQNFECLNSADHRCIKAKVESIGVDSEMYVHCRHASCPYYLGFKFTKLCNCPHPKRNIS